MVWNEQDHPRDDEGKFTFKNGGSSSNTKENPASVLYRDSKIKIKYSYEKSYILYINFNLSNYSN